MSSSSVDRSVTQEFMFQVLDIDTPRQEGRVINLFINYRYAPDLATKDYPDYREVRRAALDFIKIRPAEPAMEYWEVLNRDLVRHIKETFRFTGVSVQTQVCASDRHGLSEPGIHASISTIGDIEPLAYRGFEGDCPPRAGNMSGPADGASASDGQTKPEPMP